MNIEVKAEQAEQTKNDQNTNPHIMEAKSHENLSNLPGDQQEKNFNFFEENNYPRKSSKENNQENNMNPQSSLLISK